MEEGSPFHVFKRRQATESWNAKHRDRYLEQKRELAARPEYRAHRREMYRQKTRELNDLGILPRPKGRPRLYEEGHKRRWVPDAKKADEPVRVTARSPEYLRGYQNDHEQSTSGDTSQESD